jgi:hypothetical protein
MFTPKVTLKQYADNKDIKNESIEINLSILRLRLMF